MLDEFKKLLGALGRDKKSPPPVLPYQLTDDPARTDSPYRPVNPSARLDVTLDEMTVESHNPNKRSVERIRKAIADYPNQPQFYNYLAHAYTNLSQPAKALEVHRKAHEKFPGYLYARIGLAEKAQDEGDFEEQQRLLGETMRLEDLYPERKIFQKSEVVNYYTAAGIYHANLLDFERAEEALSIVNFIDEKSLAAEVLGMTILSKQMMRGQENIARMNRNQISLEAREFSYENQTDTPPAFHHAEMDWLYEHDTVLPPDKVRAILALPRETLLEDLEAVLQDGIRRFDYFNSQDWDGKTNTFLYHAIILLGELRAVESLPAVLDQLRQGDEYLEYWFADWLDDLFQTPLYHMGREQLDMIQDFLQEPYIEAHFKSQAAQVLELVGLLEPERLEEVEGKYRDIIQYFLDHADDQTLLDTDLLAFLISDAIGLRLQGLEPLAREVYDRELATYGIMGEWEDVENEFAEDTFKGNKLAWYYGDAFKQYKHLQKMQERIAERDRQAAERLAAESRYKISSRSSPNSWTPDEPLRVEKIGRNERVTVKYLDGTVKKDVKYKSVEDDVVAGKAVLV